MHLKKSGSLFLLLVLTVSALPVAHAEEVLDCKVGRNGAAPLPLNNKIVDGLGEVSDTTNSLGIRMDASLAPSSFIFVMQDDTKQQRVAFTGTPLAVSWDGARIATPNAELGCRQRSTEPAKEIISVSRKDVSYFVCMLDEATIAGGSVASSKRILQTVSSAMSFRLPLKVNAETDQYSFSVTSFDLDPVNGLSIRLTDKSNGQFASFAGPPKSVVGSFLFGFTQGDRNADAKFLRLGCVFTDEPQDYLVDMKK